MSDPTRYRVANNQAQLTLGGGILAVDPAGPLVDYADYARLKAEVERLNTGIQPEGSNDAVGRAVNVLLEKQKEIANLKAEVEAQAKRWAESEDLISHYKQQMDEVINNCQCSRLKAEVERLRKAGDGMEEVIWLQGCVSGMEIKERAVKAWKQAKEGKV